MVPGAFYLPRLGDAALSKLGKMATRPTLARRGERICGWLADIVATEQMRRLQHRICSGMEEWYYTGQKLKEIRDDRLYLEDGFHTWEKYVKDRWDWGRTYAHNLIESSEYRAVFSSRASTFCIACAKPDEVPSLPPSR